MKRRKKQKRRILLSVFGMALGVLILLIPFILDQYHQHQNEKAISSMTSRYDRYEDYAEALNEQLEEARKYNEWIAGQRSPDGILPYKEQLSFDPDGIMGYLIIPSIELKILIYHGTDEETLAAGAGHLMNTSLPIGGTSSHSVITAHSGMRSMRAFDDIRKLKKGDLFAACIYGRQYVYEVTGSEVVLPFETETLGIKNGTDAMTLVTCTPYGINDHRLLVHGERTDKSISLTDEREKEEGKIHPSSFHFTLNIRTFPLLLAGFVLTGVLVFLALNANNIRRKRNK